ncbi:MAG: hypothetical protein AVDCRST_MAG07-2265, partial [uncultured Frankineae bacterium]
DRAPPRALGGPRSVRSCAARERGAREAPARPARRDTM